MLSAFRSVKAQCSKFHKLQLVLVGRAFRNDSLSENQQIRSIIQSFKLTDEVRVPGFVPDEDLVALYNLASGYVQPSFAEGFGLPVLEAMASGCPVVASRATSIDEIAGPAIRVDPHDHASIAQGIKSVLELTDAKRRQRIKEGNAWVRQFSWHKVAKETIASYEKALGRI